MGYEEFIGYVNDRHDMGEQEWLLFCNVLDYIRFSAESAEEEYTMLKSLLLGVYNLSEEILQQVRLV